MLRSDFTGCEWGSGCLAVLSHSLTPPLLLGYESSWYHGGPVKVGVGTAALPVVSAATLICRPYKTRSSFASLSNLLPWTPTSSMAERETAHTAVPLSSLPPKQLKNRQFPCIQDLLFVFIALWLFHYDIFGNSWQHFLIKYASVLLMDILVKKEKYLCGVFWSAVMKPTVFKPNNRLLLW